MESGPWEGGKEKTCPFSVPKMHSHMCLSAPVYTRVCLCVYTDPSMYTVAPVPIMCICRHLCVGFSIPAGMGPGGPRWLVRLCLVGLGVIAPGCLLCTLV
jgi:hypothetical protein